MEENKPELKDTDSLETIISDLPEEKQAEIMGVVAIEQRSYQGPLPHPEHFASYERTAPGAADRILTMAEKQQEDRFKANAQDRKRSFVALWIGSILILLLIGVACVAILSGYPTLAGVLLTPIVSLAVIYVLKKKPD